MTQFVELIGTLGPDTKSDAPARFISIAAFIFTAFFAQWAGGWQKDSPLLDATGLVCQRQE
jgi:hypothetical protein